MDGQDQIPEERDPKKSKNDQTEGQSDEKSQRKPCKYWQKRKLKQKQKQQQQQQKPQPFPSLPPPPPPGQQQAQPFPTQIPFPTSRQQHQHQQQTNPLQYWHRCQQQPLSIQTPLPCSALLPVPPTEQQQHQQRQQQQQQEQQQKKTTSKPKSKTSKQKAKKLQHSEKTEQPKSASKGNAARQPQSTSSYFQKGKFNFDAINTLSPSEVQSILATHVRGVKQIINSDNEENEEMQQIALLRALALACEAGKSEKLTKILSAIKGSTFLCHDVPKILREMQQQQNGENINEKDKNQVIADMISLYETFLRSLPSAYSDLPLDEMQRCLKKITFDCKSEMEQKLDALKKERDDYIHDMRAKSAKPCKQASMNKKPPNDFRELQICPTVQELAMDQKPFLRANVKKGSYEGVEHYLDVQFRLYREDFITPLRDGIREIVKKIPRAERDQNIKTYDKVQIKRKQYSRNGIIYTLHFDVSRFKTTRWESSRRLIFGSFLCLSKDNFANILFATVANRDPKELAKGFLDISFVEGQNVHGIELRQTDQYIMAESPAYFEAYRHVLAALQNLREGSLPFQKYLVECSKDVDAPAYLRDKKEPVRYDLREALDVPEVNEAKDVALLQPDQWPDVDHLPLNDSQYEALRTALTKEFSVIQGPPGTGKTYVGLKIARCLLTNSHAWNPTQDSPILMVCFTNHALDQFLEGILDFMPKGIIRVGSRCKSERLEKCNLKNDVNIGSEQRWTNRAKLEKQQQRIESIKKAFEKSEKVDGIIDLGALEESNCITKEHLDNLYYSNLYDDECQSLQDVFESWICNKSNTRLKVDHSKVTPAFKPDCQVPSQVQPEVDEVQKHEDEESADEQGWGEADHYSQPRTPDTGEESETSEDNDVMDNINSHLPKNNPGLFNCESTTQTLNEDDDRSQENPGLQVKTNQTSDIDASKNNNNVTSQEVVGEVTEPQDFEEERDDNDQGWTEVKRKKKTVDKPLTEAKTKGEIGNQESQGPPEQQTEVAAGSQSTAAEESETIDIQEELLHFEQSRYLVGDEDLFLPITTEINFSDKDDEDRVKEADKEKVIEQDGVNNALQDQLSEMKLEKERQTHTDHNRSETGAENHFDRDQNKGKKKKNRKGNKNKNKSNKATTPELRGAMTRMKSLTKMTDEEIEDIEDIWDLSHDERLRLYLTWIDLLREHYRQRIVQEERAYDGVCKEIDNNRMAVEEEILRKAKVIGMTTTGAARYHVVLQRIKPRIVIIEEAAEVLEAHIITSLARDTEQVILIGDHKQLRPKPTMYNLAIKYNLEISLFERMVLNNMDCKMLSIQHRMRPEIAQLTKRIYEDQIDDHASVTEFEDVRGMKTNLFFLDHRQEESFHGGLQSFSNKHEAEMMVALCRYLLQQEYKPSQITILTMYTGQLLTFKDKMPRKEFCGVRVTVVDNFQGEENDIILLSLVRSNTNGNIGFLKESNRICVALSRARKGFYCMGNFALLSKDRLWKEICEELKNKDALSDTIPLACMNHREITSVSKASDFTKVPLGGCGRRCDLRLPCGHRCQERCHGTDPEHTNSRKCQKACSTLCPEQKHRCQARCHHPRECNLCPVLVTKLFPTCGHEGMAACGVDAKTRICEHLENKTLACGHQKPVPCFLDPLKSLEIQRFEIEKEIRKLQYATRTRRPYAFGHYAFQRFKEDDGANDHNLKLHTLEGKELVLNNWRFYERTLACEERCHSLCKRGMHPCEKTCHHGQECAPCKVPFENEIPRCGHRVLATCGTNFEALVCQELCRRQLKCGHPCKERCKVDCSTYKCQVQCLSKCENNHPCQDTCHYGKPCGACKVIIEKVLPNCKHIARSECHVDASSIPCMMPCERTRTCGHPCKKKCSQPCNTSKCKEKELKTLPCKHLKLLRCHLEASQYLCKEKVTKELPCGHKIQMQCNMDPSQLEYLCKKEVTKELPCGHKIQMQCNVDPSQLEYLCKEEVTKELPCGHQTQMQCSVDLFQYLCREEVTKELPCGHQIQMQCNMDPSRLEYLCKEEVTKELPCGHETQMPCNEDSSQYLCKEEVTNELPCGHKIQMQCNVDPSQYLCKEEVTKELPCGHKIQMQCNMGPSQYLCKEEVTTKLPCGHETQMPCNEDSSQYLCKEEVTKELTCGHQIQMQCNMDPSQLEYLCKEEVTKELPCGHKIQVQCNVDPSQYLCKEEVTKELPCGHKVQMHCNMDPSQYLCKEEVTKELTCGHTIQMSCNMDPSKYLCQREVTRELQCHHNIQIQCNMDPSQYHCKEVTTKLPCGHETQMPCNEDSSQYLCKEEVTKELPCGHQIQMQCNMDPSRLEYLCKEEVTTKLPCGHETQMPCNEDSSQYLCKEEVTKELPCGHQIQMQCNMDPSRLEYLCKEEVTKELPCGHQTQIQCNMGVSQYLCQEEVTKELACGHKIQMQCNMDSSQIICKEVVTKQLQCGHDIQLSCNIDPLKEMCSTVVERNLSCGHTAHITCETDMSLYSCKELTTKKLSCGHDIKLPCDTDLSKHICRELVLKKLQCGHDNQMQCNFSPNDFQCKSSIRKELKCGHIKEILCSTISDATEAILCNEIVEKKLPCEHTAKVPCFKDTKDVVCEKLVERGLSCKHVKKLACRETNADSKCQEEVLETQPWRHVKQVACHENPKGPEEQCNTIVTEILECGHEAEVPCNVDVRKISCEKLTENGLPCGHDVKALHSDSNVSTISCEVKNKQPSSQQEDEMPSNVDVATFSTDKDTTAIDFLHNHKLGEPLNEEISFDKHTKHFEASLKETSYNGNVITVLHDKQVMKQLPCGHKYLMSYDEDASKTFCFRRMKKELPCGHKMEVPCNVEVNKVVCVERTKKRLQCGHVKDLPCSTGITTVLCNIRLVKKLPCNHEIELPCHKTQEEFICQRQCERLLPCNHQCKQKCFETCDPKLCTEATSKKVPCPNKHKITVPCNVKVQNTYVCNTEITKLLSCGHLWKGECSKSTLPFRCEIVESRVLACPGKHRVDLPCYVDVRKIPCGEKCTKLLRCGHPCKLYCDEPCNPRKCNERVPKTFKECGHTKWLPCGIFSKAICLYDCLRPLKGCGHRCQGVCGKPCNKPCLYEVFKTLPCGHKLKMKCCDPVEYVRCPLPCTEKLECGHVCTGNCSTCQEKGDHEPCPLPCGRTLLCSHRCRGDCSDPCPPCYRDCRGWCPHGRCQKTCSKTCEPCNMPCANTCPHLKCNNLCHEMCDREPCDKPCLKMLACGHPCIGLCGETCPTLCYVCTPAKVAAVSPNRQRNKELRFIQLNECGHVIEFNRMDTWMHESLETATNGQAQPRRCPICSVPIYFSFRYGNIVREALQMMFESDRFKEARAYLYGEHTHTIGRVPRPSQHRKKPRFPNGRPRFPRFR